MTTLTISKLQQIIEEKNTSLIQGTKLSGGTEINGIPLNFPIANALHSLSTSESTFSKAEVYLEEVMEDENGYLFVKNGKTIFLAYNDSKKTVSEVIIKEGEIPFEDDELSVSLLQSFLLLEMALDLTSENVKDHLISLKGIDIEMGSPESTTLSYIVDKLEEFIKHIKIGDITTSEFNVNSQISLLEEVLKANVPLPTLSEKPESVTTKIDDDILGEEKDDNIVPVQQISFFEDEVETIVPAPKKERRKNNKSKPNQTEKVLTKVIPVATLDDVKKYSSLIFDDAKAEEKFLALGFDNRTVKAALEFRKIQRESILTPEQMLLIPNKITYVGWSEPVEDTVVALLTKNHILIKAEAGTGKSTMVRTVCALLNYPMFFIGGSVDADIETFLGFKTLENGNVEFVDGPVVKAIKCGGLIYLDEGNTVMESVLIKLHSVLDDQGEIFVEASGEVYKVHPNTRFITTINDGYAGTREFNDATADRMVGIEMDYMSSEHLWGLLENFDGGFTEYQKDILKMGRIPRGDLIILTEIAKALQIAAKEGIIEPKVASTRNIIALLKTTRLYSFKKAIRFVLKKYSKDDQPSIASILETVEDLGLTASDMLSM